MSVAFWVPSDADWHALIIYHEVEKQLVLAINVRGRVAVGALLHACTLCFSS